MADQLNAQRCQQAQTGNNRGRLRNRTGWMLAVAVKETFRRVAAIAVAVVAINILIHALTAKVTNVIAILALDDEATGLGVISALIIDGVQT